MKWKQFAMVAVFPTFVACGGSQPAPTESHEASTSGDQAPAWSAECVARRGCPNTQAIAPCGPSSASMDVAAALAGTPGTAVTVRAYLTQSMGMMTLMGCAPGACCNHAAAALALVSLPMASVASPDVLQLRLEGEAWGCQGDDSGFCCAYTVEGSASAHEVLVAGVLSGEPGSIALQPASICSL
jgi:hypothetical protein